METSEGYCQNVRWRQGEIVEKERRWAWLGPESTEVAVAKRAVASPGPMDGGHGLLRAASTRLLRAASTRGFFVRLLRCVEFPRTHAHGPSLVWYCPAPRQPGTSVATPGLNARTRSYVARSRIAAVYSAKTSPDSVTLHWPAREGVCVSLYLRHEAHDKSARLLPLMATRTTGRWTRVGVYRRRGEGRRLRASVLGRSNKAKQSS